MRTVWIFLAFPLLLGAQDRYATWERDGDVCPRVVKDGPVRPGGNAMNEIAKPGNNLLSPIGNAANAPPPPPPADATTSGVKGAGLDYELNWKTGVRFFPPDQRKDVGRFAAIDRGGTVHPMSKALGHVLVVGFWSVGCQPSLYLLGEMAELNGKAEKAGFELFSVNYDPERWSVVERYVRQTKVQAELRDLPIYIPGMGDQGPNCLVSLIPALPAYFIIDRQGRVAVEGLGYKDGDLVRYLKKVLVEPMGAPSSPAALPLPSEPAGVSQKP